VATTDTTLSAAVARDDTSILVASLSNFAANDIAKIDGEVMKVVSVPSAATIPVPVIRGIQGTAQVAHVSGARVIRGATPTAAGSDWGDPPVGNVALFAGPRAFTKTSISATSTLTLPKPGEELLVALNGTSAITLTIPVPTEDMDGTILWIASNGVAQHLLTFTGGLNGAGASYDIITINATAPAVVGPFMAINGLWMLAVAAPLSGTTTAIAAAIA
jgi:hypothetical protein